MTEEEYAIQQEQKKMRNSINKKRRIEKEKRKGHSKILDITSGNANFTI